jgi:hypothetical protein
LDDDAGFGGGVAGSVNSGADYAGGGGAGFGGAIFNHNGTLHVTNSTFNANTAAGGTGADNGSGSGFGGAIFNLNGTVTLTFSTLAGNTADNGGAIYNLGYSLSGLAASLTVSGTILSDSVSSGATAVDDLVNNEPSTVASGTTNAASATVTYQNGNIVEISSNTGGTVNGSASLTGINKDPGLAGLAPNPPGSTDTMAITSGSSAFEATSCGTTTVDQRGVTRPQGSLCDIGAYELILASPVLSVSKTHTGNFTQGQTGTWTITVSNTQAGSTTSGTVMVTDTLPNGYTVKTASGTDWSCTGTGTAALSCTNSDPVAGSTSFGAITLVANVPSNSPTSVNNTASASGGGAQQSASSPIDTVTVNQVPATILTNVNTTPQSTNVNTPFPYSLAVTVEDAGSKPVSGVPVVFTAPPNGASGTFSNSTNTITVSTATTTGIANAGTFTANGTAGGAYTVTATATGTGLNPAVFSLTNLANTYLLTTGVSPSGGGTVTPTGTSNYYAATTVVPLKATANPGYVFSSWSGSPVAVTGTGSTASVTMGSAPETVTAYFTSALTMSPTTVNFGQLYLDEAAAQTLKLTNTSNLPITISSIKASGGTAPGDYGEINSCAPYITSMPGTLAAGKTCTIAVGILATAKVFSPTASTSYLTITSSAAGSPDSELLTATVINPVPSLSALSLNFSQVKVGTNAVQTLTIKNKGNTPVDFTGVTISGNFVILSNTCTGALAATTTASCTIGVEFTPKSKGLLTGTLKIADNALIGTQTVLLTGTGK